MQILNDANDISQNLLPFDGAVHYWGKIFTQAQADSYLNSLQELIAWQQDETVIFGRRIVTQRKVAWYGDEPFHYRYSNTTKIALPWTSVLQTLKSKVEKVTGESFNSCLLNLYHSGNEGMGWHSDDEPDLKKEGAIASLSFGAERKFVFKHKNIPQKVEIFLEHGSLLVMTGLTQIFWKHRLPPSKRVLQPRINLTFRTIVN